MRAATGTAGRVESARAAIAVLTGHDLPPLLVGGRALQDHGCPRVTIDVDLAVNPAVRALYLETGDALQNEK